MGKEDRMKKKTLFLFMAMGILVSSLSTGFTAHAEEKPIVIGLMTDLTSFLSINGIPLRKAAIMAMEEANYTVAGRKIKFIIEDSASNPATGMDRARKLIESDKACIIMGPFHGGVAAAVAGYAGKVGIPQIVTWYSLPTDKMHTFKWSWSPFGTLEQLTTPTGAYAYDVLGYRTMTTMGTDYLAGRKFIQGATDSFQQRGGKVIQQQWIPLGTKDIAPYISNLKKADVLSPWLAGITATVGLRQIKEFGVKMPVVMPQTGFPSHPVQIKQIADHGLGIITTDAYVWTIPTPANKDFVARFKKRWGELPAGAAYGGYFSTQVAIEALRKSGGDTSPKALAKALDATRIKGILGDFYFGDARIGIGNYFVHKVVKGSGDQPYRTDVLAKYQVRAEQVGPKDIKFKLDQVEMQK